jgi:hypothetical protein
MSTIEHYLRADLHAYFASIGPKSLRETLCVPEHALQQLAAARPGYDAGGSIEHHLSVIGELIRECDRQRPLGPDGKHGNRHTSECGCDLEAVEDVWAILREVQK